MPAAIQPMIQRRLNMRVEISAPLMDLDAVRGVLGIDREEVETLISDSKLAFAFHIELDAGTRKEVRVLSRCVRGYQTTSTTCGMQHESIENVIGWILAREHKPFILGNRLRELFVCSRQLIIDLCRTGQLSTLNSHPGTASWRRGRDGTPAITRESVTRFLKERRMQ